MIKVQILGGEETNAGVPRGVDARTASYTLCANQMAGSLVYWHTALRDAQAKYTPHMAQNRERIPSSSACKKWLYMFSERFLYTHEAVNWTHLFVTICDRKLRNRNLEISPPQIRLVEEDAMLC